MALASPSEARMPNASGVAELAKAAMAETGAKGLAIAVIDDGRATSAQAFGDRNAKGDPLTTETVMYGASLTKAVFAYTVMQLAEEGRIDLDASIATYLPKPLPEYGNLDEYGNWGDLRATSGGAGSRRESCVRIAQGLRISPSSSRTAG